VQGSGRLAEFEAALSPVKSPGQTTLCPYPHAPGCGGAAGGYNLVAYGYMAELARQAACQLAYESEIFTELVIPTQLAPFEAGGCAGIGASTGRLLSIEEGSLSLGWGAEILARSGQRRWDPACERRAGWRQSSCPSRLPGILEAKASAPASEQVVQTAQKWYNCCVPAMPATVIIPLIIPMSPKR